MQAPRHKQQLVRSATHRHFRRAEAFVTASAGGPVESYRLYILNPVNGRIADARDFEAPDADTAIWISEGVRHTRPMELWQGRRRIHVWQALGSKPKKPTEAETPPMPGPTLFVR